MANKRKAAIVTVGLLAIAGVAVMPAWLRLKEMESKGLAVGPDSKSDSIGVLGEMQQARGAERKENRMSGASADTGEATTPVNAGVAVLPTSLVKNIR